MPQIPQEEDSDVAVERNVVNALSRAELSRQSLVCQDLTKFYNKFLAVKRLTFGE